MVDLVCSSLFSLDLVLVLVLVLTMMSTGMDLDLVLGHLEYICYFAGFDHLFRPFLYSVYLCLFSWEMLNMRQDSIFAFA